MKLPAALLLSLVATVASAAAQEKSRPTQPDPDYCSRRDADPKQCLIQDGPPNPNIIRKPPPRPPSAPLPAPAPGTQTKKMTAPIKP
jgi:hypothetical protein